MTVRRRSKRHPFSVKRRDRRPVLTPVAAIAGEFMPAPAGNIRTLHTHTSPLARRREFATMQLRWLCRQPLSD